MGTAANHWTGTECTENGALPLPTRVPSGNHQTFTFRHPSTRLGVSTELALINGARQSKQTTARAAGQVMHHRWLCLCLQDFAPVIAMQR